MADTDVKNKRGIYEFLLGGESDTKLLDVRVFDDKTKLAAYGQQTAAAEAAETSNCPTCALGNNNITRIYDLGEMDAGHVTACRRVEPRTSPIARCSASRTTARRVTGSLLRRLHPLLLRKDPSQRRSVLVGPSQWVVLVELTLLRRPPQRRSHGVPTARPRRYRATDAHFWRVVPASRVRLV